MIPFKKHLVFSPSYNTPLSSFGIDKPFALDRGELVLEQLEKDFARPVETEEPIPVRYEDLLLVHGREYLESLQEPETWIKIMELKESEYSPQKATKQLPDLLEDLKLKSGGTMRAAELSLANGLAANLGGGYHHAFPNEGRGFCVIHDIAIAICSLQKRGLIKTALIVDLDFHQGDGSALIFQGNDSVFTFSVHSREGWPDLKQNSDLDIEIGQGEESTYLEKLEQGLNEALRRCRPDFAIYVAGSDPYELDVLPGTSFMKLSLEQLRLRDEMVIDRLEKENIAQTMVFAGGYGPHVWKVHYQGVRHLLAKAGIFPGAVSGIN